MKLALGRAFYDPGDPMGKMFFNILATFAEFEADLIRMRTPRVWQSPAPGGNCAASSPNCPTDSSGNYAACMPPASIPSAISPSSSPSRDQPSMAHSTGVIPLSVRSCPLPESTRDGLGACFRGRLPARRRAWSVLPPGRFHRCCHEAAGRPGGPSGNPAWRAAFCPFCPAFSGPEGGVGDPGPGDVSPGRRKWTCAKKCEGVSSYGL